MDKPGDFNTMASFWSTLLRYEPRKLPSRLHALAEVEIETVPWKEAALQALRDGNFRMAQLCMQADGQEETTSVENHTPISEDTEIENEVLEATENETISEKLEEETTVSVQDEIDNHLAEASEEGSIDTDLEIEVKDYGCTLKLMKTKLAKDIDLYGELHRFIPILASIRGAKIAEVDVKHHPRRFGVSKYGLGRTLRVASDLLLMAFFIKYRQKPMHLFGSLGLGSLGLGSLISAYLAFDQFILGDDIGTRPLFFAGILLILTGIQLICTGFIAELLMRTYFSSKNSKPYTVEETEKVNGY
jgi:hypothetical protein